MVDCFFPNAAYAGGFRKSSFRVKANGSEEAIREARNGIFGDMPYHFHVRAAFGKGYTVIYRSEDA
jgi:hypothetical protein